MAGVEPAFMLCLTVRLHRYTHFLLREEKVLYIYIPISWFALALAKAIGTGRIELPQKQPCVPTLKK